MICTHCKIRESRENLKLCNVCADTAAACQKTTIQKRRALGVCTDCGKPVVPGKRRCQEDLDRQSTYRKKMRDLVFQAYGGYKCACCGETIEDFLTLDHIDGKGCEHRRQLSGSGRGGGSVSTYRWLIVNNFPSGFQILCFNCNYSKYRNGECIHKKLKQGNH